MAITIDGSNGIDIGAGNLTFPDDTTQTTAPIGAGQTWQNLTASRAKGTTYTNSTGRPIMVAITVSNDANICSYYVDSIKVGSSGFFNSYGINNPRESSSSSFIVPDGSTYYITNTTNTTIISWAELR